VTVTRATTPGHGSSSAAAPAAASAASTGDGGGASKGLGVTALIVGALGLVAGLAAFGLRRRGLRTS
jgi:hypothetical protein